MYLDLIGQIALAVIGLALVALVAVQAAGLARLRRVQQGLQCDIGVLQQDLMALCSGASSVGSHLGRVDQQLMRLTERQDHLELNDSVQREYDHAVKLIRKGSGVEEIMAKCNLLRTEAELLMRLHGRGDAIAVPDRASALA